MIEPRVNADSMHAVKFSRAVVPSDTDQFQITRGLWVGGDGDIEVMYYDGSTDTITGVLGGTLLPFQVVRVMSATTATDIRALY